MLELARYYGRKRLRASIALTAGIAALVAMYIALFPSITGAVDMDSIVNNYPAALRSAFDIRTLNTIEGYLATQLYAFAWVLLLGIYFAYAGATIVAGDVEDRRLDLTLSLPVSRSRVLLEKFASLSVPLVVANVAMPVVVLAVTALIGEDVSMAKVLAAHALSIPYLLACGALGVTASVVADRASVAQRVAVGVLFGSFLVDSVVTGTDFSALGLLSPMRYYDSGAILVEGQYDLAGKAVLLAATAGLLVLSREYFRRRDIN